MTTLTAARAAGTSLREKLAWRLRTGKLLYPPQRVRHFSWRLLGRMLGGSIYERWYWYQAEHRQAYAALCKTKSKLIHANDWLALPAAIRAAKFLSAKVLLDLHEYAPLEMEQQRGWHTFNQPMIDYFLHQYANRSDEVITVCQSIADRYAATYGFQPSVIMNAPAWESGIDFRPADPRCVRLIHHGGSMRTRRLELMIDTVRLADTRYELHFMLVGDETYEADLKAYAQRVAPGRVFFHPPVTPEKIVRSIAAFDIGIFVLPFFNYNWQVALPNKFFDFINAGLAVTIGPSPEMARLVHQYGFGMVAPSFEPAQVAATLNNLTATELDAMKQRALSARTMLNADVEMEKLLSIYKRLLAEKT